MRAYESMEEKPSIETTKNAFKIILPNINAKYETGKFSAPKAEAITSSAAGAEKKLSNEEKVLKYARFHGTITRNDVIELLEVSTSTASRVIRRMVKSNLLKQNGKVRYIFALLRILAMCSKDFCEVAEMNETENKSERTDLFLEKLKKDSPRYSGLETTGYSLAEKKNTIRSLMNIRMPGALSDELVNLQDEYLQEERKAKGVVVLADIPTVREQFNSGFPHADKISIWQGDITRLKAGAVVNAANSQMLGCFVPCHRCIDNAIHSAAGMQLREECAHIMSRRRSKYGRDYEEPTGTATLTAAYNLPCDHVIHTVGPIVYGGLNDMLCQDLRNCYENVLQCCLEHQIRSVAFCCISTGEFHFPNDKAAEIAVETVVDFLEKHDDRMDRVVFNVFKDSDREIYEKILG